MLYLRDSLQPPPHSGCPSGSHVTDEDTAQRGSVTHTDQMRQNQSWLHTHFSFVTFETCYSMHIKYFPQHICSLLKSIKIELLTPPPSPESRQLSTLLTYSFFILPLLKGKPRHIKNFKNLFEQKSIWIRQHQREVDMSALWTQERDFYKGEAETKWGSDLIGCCFSSCLIWESLVSWSWLAALRFGFLNLEAFTGLGLVCLPGLLRQ